VVPYVVGAAGILGVATLAGMAGAIYWHAQAEDHDELLAMGDNEPAVLARYNNYIEKRDLAIYGMWVTGLSAVTLGALGFGIYYFDTPTATGAGVKGTF
jgi:hypothetical protein